MQMKNAKCTSTSNEQQQHLCSRQTAGMYTNAVTLCTRGLTRARLTDLLGHKPKSSPRRTTSHIAILDPHALEGLGDANSAFSGVCTHRAPTSSLSRPSSQRRARGRGAPLWEEAVGDALPLPINAHASVPSTVVAAFTRARHRHEPDGAGVHLSSAREDYRHCHRSPRRGRRGLRRYGGRHVLRSRDRASLEKDGVVSRQTAEPPLSPSGGSF